MSQKKKKDLYMGKSLRDLNAIVEKKNVKRIKDQQCRMYTRSAEKLYQNAMDQCIVENDEEKAYVFFMTFLNICESIRKTQEYKKQKNYYDDMLVKKMLKAMDEAETLSASLKQRYEEREAVDVSKKLDALDSESKSKDSQEEKETEKENKEEKSEEKLANEIPESERKIGTGNGLIEPASLYNLLTDKNTTVLILDVRLEQDYNASHVMYRSCINVPPGVVKPGCVSKHIENELSPESKEVWQSRGRVDFVVIIDWLSGPNSFRPGNAIQSLKDAIYKWEQDVIVKSEPLLLEGGYSEWLTYYPTMSTNPHVQRPVSNNMSKPNVTLDQIGYDLDLDFLKSPEEKVPPAAPPQPAQNGLYPTISQNNTVANQQPGSNQPISNRPPIPDRSLKQPTLNGPLPNNRMNNVAPDKSSGSDQSNNISHLAINSSSMKASNTAAIKTINNDLKANTKTTNLDELRKKLEGTDDNINISQTSAPESKMPAVPNRNLKPQTVRAQSVPQGPSAEMLEAQQEIEEEKRKLEQEREELRQKLKHEHEQYERLREMKMREAKETADLMRKKREVQGSLKPEDTQSTKVKPDDKDAEKARLDRLLKEEQEEEERMKLAEQRLAADREAEKKQKEIEEQTRQIEEREREIQDKIKQEEQRQKEELERKEKLRLEEEKRKEQERIQKEKDAELLRQVELERIRAEKAKQERDRAEKERLEKERAERARIQQEQAERERTEKEKQLAKLERERLERERAEKEKAEKLRREQERQAEESRKAALAESTPKVYKTKLRDETDVTSSGGGGLKRSYSSPNIAKMMADEEERKVTPMPSVDRTAKPKPMPSNVQLHAPVRTKVRHFDGVWGSMGSGLTGLRNMGNTCYMNSTIQCLSNTAFLTTYLIGDSYLQHMNRENKHGTGGEIAEEFAVLVKHLWSAQYKSITPRDFKFSVARHNSMFAGYEQLDSQEFLLILLDSLHEDLNKVRNRPKLPEQKNDGVPDEVAGERAWDMHKTVHDSIMVDLFQGQYKSTVMCKTCEKKSVTFDTFMYLSLDIPSQGKCALSECLLTFSKEEKMTGDSRWNCPQCKVKRDAVKRIVIWKLPPIIIIVLKRFYYKGMWRQKISTAVDYPLEGLDLNRYISGPKARRPYDLFAVSNHFGTLDGGHYTAFCKNPKLNKWFKFDDHEVYECSKSNVKSPAAYFLFYSSIGNAFAR